MISRIIRIIIEPVLTDTCLQCYYKPVLTANKWYNLLGIEIYYLLFHVVSYKKNNL